MEISFEGIGQVVASFAGEAGVEPGMAVALTAAGTVGLGADGDPLCGVALTDDGGAVAVQVGGFVTVPYTGTAPAVGWAMVGVDGAGAVKTVAGGGLNCLIVQVDADGKTVTMKI